MLLHWKAAYHKWNRNPLSRMAQLSWLVCVCAEVHLSKTMHQVAISLVPVIYMRESSYWELSFSVLVRSRCKVWHYSEVISYCMGTEGSQQRQANSPAAIAQRFLSLLSPFNPRPLPQAQFLHSILSLGNVVSSWPGGYIYCLGGKCNACCIKGCCRVTAKCE